MVVNSLKWLIAAWLLLYIAVALWVPTGLGMDAYDGFRAGANLFSAQNFNCVPTPDAADISKDVYEFQSWFTPGQYVFICALSKAAAIPLAMATLLVVTAFGLAGLAGFYRLYLLLGFNPVVSLISLAVILLQCFFLINYIHFAGADILLFGFVPWVAIATVNTEKARPVSLVLLFALGLIGFFLKSSFLIMFLAILGGAVWLRFSRNQSDSLSPQFAFAFKMAVMYAVVVAVCWFCYLRFGDIPAQPTQVELYWSDFFFPFTAPLVAAFSLDVTLDWWYEFPIHCSFMGRKVDQSFFVFYTALSSVFAAVAFVVWIKFRKTLYLQFLAANYTVMFICFALLYVLNAEGVGNESRHFFFIGFLLLPALVKLIIYGNGWLPLRVLSGLVVIALLAFNQYLLVKNKLDFAHQRALGSSGFYYDSITDDLLQQIYRIDYEAGKKKPANRMMFLPEYGPSLDVKNYRTTTTVLRWINQDAAAYIQPAKGKTDELIFVSAPQVDDSVHYRRISMLFADVRHIEQLYNSEGGKIFRCTF